MNPGDCQEHMVRRPLRDIPPSRVNMRTDDPGHGSRADDYIVRDDEVRSKAIISVFKRCRSLAAQGPRHPGAETAFVPAG